MKKICVGIAALAALFATQASAADMAVKAPPAPPAPAWNWSGFYVGVEAGGGNARTQQTDTSGVTSGPYNQSGGLAGGTIGYNWQSKNMVFGLEADMSWTGINGSVNLPALCTAGSGSVCFTNMHWLNTDRVRFGFTTPSNQFLFYVTGGLAGASIRSGQESCSTPVAGAIASCGTKTEWAGVGGGGIEAMLAPKWTAKVEYLYTNFGTHTLYTVFIPVNVAENRVNILRAGVNYHF
jgi:outer membrane immunogenic protein